MDIPAVDLPQSLELLLGLVHHVQNILRPFTQQHSLFCQPDGKAAADEQLFAQLGLQLLELLG